ncbi:MAG: hypothetical protein ACI4E0_12855 [Blautia sp.]
MIKNKIIILAMTSAYMLLTACTIPVAENTPSLNVTEKNTSANEWSGSDESTDSNVTSEETADTGPENNTESIFAPSSDNNENEKVNKDLSVPRITECRYIHQMYFTPDCLSVEWSSVEGASNYEMEMCDADFNVIKTYKTSRTRISISENRGDNAVTGCLKGNKIRIRAIDADGNPGNWTEYSTIGCNSLFDKT